jgi:hypothetical protein
MKRGPEESCTGVVHCSFDFLGSIDLCRAKVTEVNFSTGSEAEAQSEYGIVTE